MADEGSVMIDGVDAEETSQPSTENFKNQQETSSEQEKDVSNSQETTSEEPKTTVEEQEEEVSKEAKPDGKVEGEAEKTDKGTKLAEDPLSRANQLRANAESEARAYYSLLNDPTRLEAYLEELKAEKGISAKTETSEDFGDLDPSKLETVEDLQKFAAGLKDATRREIEEVKAHLYGLSTAAQMETLSRRIQSEISEVQSKYPELRESLPDGTRNPEYNEDLDFLISSTYNELDLDKRTGQYRGKVNLIDIADKIMSAKRVGESAGSRKAKTDVIDKRLGRISGIGVDTRETLSDDTKLSPAAAIAERMKRVSARRR